MIDQGASAPQTSDTWGRRETLGIGMSGVALAMLRGSVASAGPAQARVSAFGSYSGFSDARFDGWVRTSEYVAMRDGVKLAVDVYRPTSGGKLHQVRLPVVWQPKRYQRAIVREAGRIDHVMTASSDNVAGGLVTKTALRLSQHGYVIVSLDRRGTGASFGTRSELSDPRDATDGYDLTEWLARQSWSDGHIGMFGASYEGEMQLRVAGLAPPHLKAIMPEVSPFDWYWTVHPGGIARTSQAGFAGHLLKIDTDPSNAPVDADGDRSQLLAALAEHKAANDYSAPAGKLPFRDSKNPKTGEQNWLARHGGHLAEGLRKSGIAVYHITGWFSNVGIHQWIWYANQKNPRKKMLIGPWAAGGARGPEERELCAVEAHRFFDYWLKGIDNGIMVEPAIHSSVPSSHTRAGTPWRGLPAAWPLADEQRVEFFFGPGRTGTSGSVNDGKLTRRRPSGGGARDDLIVRYDCEYKGGVEPAEAGKKPIDHADFDAQGLTYTTEALEADTEVTGHGVAQLWVSSTATDGDFFLKLQDVDPAGHSTFVAQGALRASHRQLRRPPYDNLGLPWNSSFEADIRPLAPGEPTALTFALFPTSYIFPRGHRMRLTITGSDLDTGPSPKVEPAPVMSLYRSARYASSITLPIIPHQQGGVGV